MSEVASAPVKRVYGGFRGARAPARPPYRAISISFTTTSNCLVRKRPIAASDRFVFRTVPVRRRLTITCAA